MSKDDPERAARLSAALRINLRRRKARTRALETRAADPPEPPRPNPGKDDA